MSLAYVFSGQVALVTGAASGMGLATAAAFTESGATVVLADRDRDAVERAADEITGPGGRAVGVAEREWAIRLAARTE